MPTADDSLSRTDGEAFTEDERRVLNAAHSSTRFLAQCWRIRLAYQRAQVQLPSTKPTAERRRIRRILKALNKARTEALRRAVVDRLTVIDCARIALHAPGLDLAREPLDAERLADALSQMEAEEAKKIKRRRHPEYIVAYRVRRLFERFNIDFKDYDNDDTKMRGAAASVIKVILQAPQKNVRHLIQDAMKPEDAE